MYPEADKPTMYFIGVTTSQSAIMRVFPHWAKALDLGDCVLKGMDFKLHDEPERYRAAVSHIKTDPLSLGALVTSHKLDLLKASRDLFDELGPYADALGEVSSISKRNGKLVGHAKDPVTAGLALKDFLPQNYWKETGAEVFIIGAGGSSLALTCHLMAPQPGEDRPSRIVVSNRSLWRLEEMQQKHKRLGMAIPTEYVHAPEPVANDRVMSTLKPHSLIANATGLGKDAPGSPLTDAAVFPRKGIAWDFNYRGDLVFLDQARAQKQEKDLIIVDGWVYFIHGWIQVISEVFHVEIPTEGPEFDRLSEIAREHR